LATLNDGYVTIGKAALMLNLSQQTISRWYRWWQNDNFEHPKDMFLPEYFYKDRRKIRHFRVEDLPLLQVFHEQLKSTHSGVMAEFNAAYQWGKKGEIFLRKRNSSVKQVKAKFN